MRAFIRLPAPFGTPSPEPHLTVLYVDEVTGTDDANAVLDAIEAALLACPGAIDAVFREVRADFGPDHDIRVAVMESPGAASLRRDILAEMASRGIGAAQTYPRFVPHVTIDESAEPEAFSAREVLVSVGPPAEGNGVSADVATLRYPLGGDIQAVRGRARDSRIYTIAQVEALARGDAFADAAGMLDEGRWFRVLAEGENYTPLDGTKRATVTRAGIDEMVRVFRLLGPARPPRVDWNHLSNLNLRPDILRTPENAGALGRVVAVEGRQGDDGRYGLYARFRLNQRGRQVVADAQAPDGTADIWPSAEFQADLYDRETGTRIGGPALVGVGLQSRQQQYDTAVDAIAMSEPPQTTNAAPGGQEDRVSKEALLQAARSAGLDEAGLAQLEAALEGAEDAMSAYTAFMMDYTKPAAAMADKPAEAAPSAADAFAEQRALIQRDLDIAAKAAAEARAKAEEAAAVTAFGELLETGRATAAERQRFMLDFKRARRVNADPLDVEAFSEWSKRPARAEAERTTVNGQAAQSIDLFGEMIKKAAAAGHDSVLSYTEARL